MMFSYSVLVWTFAVAILSTEASVRGRKPGSACREPIIFQNFDMNRTLGHWYLYSHHDHDFERGCDCYTSEVTQINANTMQISNCCQMRGVSNETQTCNVGVSGARLENPEKKEALFLYTRAGALVDSRVWIIDTDYENYLIANACERVSDEEERDLFWIFSRDREISKMEAEKINNVLDANHFEKKKIIRQRHGADTCKSRRPQMGHGHGDGSQGHGSHGHGN